MAAICLGLNILRGVYVRQITRDMDAVYCPRRTVSFSEFMFYITVLVLQVRMKQFVNIRNEG